MTWKPINFDQLVFNINQKIIEIKEVDQRNIPVIFLLIGSYPGYSRIHQTPPVIKKYLDDTLICPIVVLIDSFYSKIQIEKENKTLNFLTQDNTKPNPYEWYYPDTLMPLNIKCNSRVAYQYYPNIIEKSQVELLINMDFIKSNLTHLWCFEGSFSFKNTSMLCSPSSSCMVDVDTNIEYWPIITFNIETNTYNFTPLNISINEIIDELNINKDSGNKRFLYNMIEQWCKKYSTYRKWEMFIRLNDPLSRCVLDHNSSISDWNHLYYRANIKSDNIEQIHNKFLESSHNTLKEFLDDDIYKMGITLIKLSYNQKPESYDIQVMYDKLNQEMKNENQTTLPNIFYDILHKYSNIIQHF